MKGIHCKFLFPYSLGAFFLISCVVAGQEVLAPSPIVSTVKFNWQVVVNNGVLVPSDSRNFNSYNEPSININQLVVFRARSKGGSGGEPAHGIFTRNMATGAPLMTIFDRNTLVPQPNNVDATFTEPPSFPRIDIRTDTVASRGNHPPVWNYLLGDGISETRVGTTGIYTNPFGLLITGGSNLGAAPGFGFFAVPGTNVKFDVFPSAPAVTDGSTLVFKGNYSVADSSGKTISKTGVYYRDLTNAPISLPGGTKLEPAGGTAPVVVIADTETLIPGTRTKFGSLAAPSAAGRWAAFAGFDNEDNPTKGGIYLAPLNGTRPRLRRLAEIGGPVQGEKRGTVFNKLGEGISFDGRFVAFWGAWGTQTKTLVLQCPTEGNKIRNAYCLEQYPGGFQTIVPVNQGIFVYDTVTEKTTVVTKSPTSFDDFVFWKFSGYVEGMGESEDTSEPARWRSSSFAAVSGLADGNLDDGTFHIAFKARTGQVVNGAYTNPVDGIYLYAGPGSGPTATVVTTGTKGTLIDPEAVVVNKETGGSVVPFITGLGIERDGFRGRSLVINVAMGSEDAGWAGIYMTTVPDELMK